MKAKSIQALTPDLLEQELEKQMTDGFKPTLAIIFLSIHQDRKRVVKIFDDREISVYGATTSGEFIDEDIIENSISVLLLDITKDYFKIYSDHFDDIPPRSLAQRFSTQSKNLFANPKFLIAGSNLATDAEAILRGYQDILGHDVDVFGAMAGDGSLGGDSFVFSNGFDSNNGMVAIVLDGDKVDIKGRAICGWKPVGIERTVTKSEGNRLYEIDGVTALELTRKFSGIDNFKQENQALALEIATNFPFQLIREDGPPIMRPGLVINWEDGSFMCSGSLPEGAKVRFSLPPEYDIIDEVIAGNQEFKASEMQEPDAMVMFSCAGRLYTFGPLISKEIKGVKDVWNVPMVGFFSGAELARSTEGNLEMHNFTTCCVGIKEI